MQALFLKRVFDPANCVLNFSRDLVRLAFGLEFRIARYGSSSGFPYLIFQRHQRADFRIPTVCL